MNRTKWIWAAIILLLVISLPGLWNRWQVEEADDTYEVILPYKEIYKAAKESDNELDSVLTDLKDSGLNTVSVKPTTLNALADKGKVALYSESELKSNLRFSNKSSEISTIEEGDYIAIDDDSPYKQMIQDRFDLESLKVSGQTLLFIPEDSNVKLSSALGYDQTVIDKIEDHDLRYTLRINNEDTKDDPHGTQFIVDEASEMASDDVNSIIFSGTEVAGYPESKNVKSYSDELIDVGYHFYDIEFANQKGFDTVAANSHYQIMRLHSLNIIAQKMPQNIDQAIRAVKERNIDALFFHIRSKLHNGEERLDMADNFLTTLSDDMPNEYTSGSPSPYKPVSVPTWVTVSVILASILLVYLTVERILTRGWGYATAIGLLVIGMAYLITDRTLLAQAIALATAISAPTYAVIANSTGTRKLSGIVWQYIKGLGIALAGILMITGLLNGNQFLSGITLFRGVKLVYILPIIAVGIFVLWKYFKPLLHPERMMSILKAPVKSWHVLVVVFIGAIVLYYVMRSGNVASVSDIELMLRQKLEDWLYVRPRTKEFLIGFPLYILALYTMGKGYKWGQLLLIPGTIGFLSVVNTFSHFHIPLSISLLRSFYGVIFGLIVGVLVIYIFNLIMRFVRAKLKTRWS